MVLLIKDGADRAQLLQALKGLGLWTQTLKDGQSLPRAIRLKPDSQRVPVEALEALDGVEAVLRTESPHPLLDAQARQSIAIVPGLRIGGDSEQVLATGPCAAESPAQIMAAAAMAVRAGARLLRGGAYKPRTSPYTFLGQGSEALGWLREAADAHGLALVTEAMSEFEVPAVAEVADLIQIGSRNMQNFALLARVGQAKKPVLLKRGRAASLKEWRLAAEHLLVAGATGVIFCERGILGSDPETRNCLDLAGATLLKHIDGQPVMVDPSHATGRRDLVLPLSAAALAAGVDGLLVECHPHAAEAKSDGPQALSPQEVGHLAQLMGRSPRAGTKSLRAV